jgi:D-3-phosphoglycerate dehydrogenase
MIRSSTTVTREIIERADNLKVIGRAGVGVDNVDLEAATRRGIVVMNSPHGNSVTTAEHAISMMMAMARKIPAANAALKAGKWDRSKFTGAEVCNKVLGVVGLGNIGRIVADRAQGLKMKVIGFDPIMTRDAADRLHIELVGLEEIFRRADFITVHTPLTDDTRGLIGAAAFAKMKKGVRIINCARGELIDDAALAAALKSGHVGGAALDVFAVEPLKDSPYFGLDNVILTPHIAGSTGEAQEAVGIQIARQVRDYLKLGVVQNAVNLPSLSHEEYVVLAPYIDLAGRLGSFLAQAGKGGIEAIDLTYGGALAEAKTELIRNAAIAGLLQGSENVNRINAAAVAQERGIRVHEEKQETQRGGAASVITVELHTAAGTSHASATVIHGEQPRLLEFDGIDIETPLEGDLLVCRNMDVPGVIGRIGSILGEHGVNIANFALGRERSGQRPVKALAVVQVDAPVSAAVLEDLVKIEAMLEAKPVSLPEVRI